MCGRYHPGVSGGARPYVCKVGADIAPAADTYRLVRGLHEGRIKADTMVTAQEGAQAWARQAARAGVGFHAGSNPAALTFDS